MILSDNCYLQDRCWKFRNEQGACQEYSQYCPKLFRLDYLYNEANLTQIQRKYKPLFIDEDGTDKEEFMRLKAIQDNIEEFVEKNQNLYLHSANCGNGKTAWAIRLIQAYLNKIWHKSDLRCRALFVNIPRYFMELKDSLGQENDYVKHIKKNILSADIVVFDEVATKAFTTFEHENILSIINARIDAGKTNIYTSNLSGKDLKDKIGSRLYSRIVHESVDIELFGKDKRGLQ